MSPNPALLTWPAPTSGGFDPADIAGLDLWLRAEDLTGLSHGDDIGSWADQSPAGNTYTQATTARRPHYDTSTGIPAVAFTRSQNHYMVGNADASAQTQSGLAVIRTSDGSNIATILGGSGTVSFGLDMLSTVRPRVRAWGVASDNTYPTSSSLDTIHVISGVADWSAGTSSIAIDGDVQSGGINPTALTAGRSIRVGIKGTSGEPMEGLIYEVLHYTTALSNTDRDAIRAYLANKYL